MVGVESHEVRLNYYAMVVAIIGECTVETAFEKLQSDHPDKIISRNTLTSEDSEDMRKLSDAGITYREISEFYHVPKTTVDGRIRLRRQKTG